MNIIEIEDDQVRFSSVEFKEGKFLISKLGIFNKPLDDKNRKDITRCFSNSLDKIVVSIPRRKVSMHYHSFPSQKIDELENMAHFQALKQFPYKDLNVIYDLSLLLKEQSGYTKVNLSVMAEDILNKYINEVKDFILPDRVTVNSVGVVGFYKLLKDDKDKILIEVGNHYSNLCIISGGKLFFSREVSKGYYSIKDDGLKPWLDEVLHSVESFNKEKLIPEIDSAVILGPKRLNILEKIKDSLPFKSVEFIYQEDFIEKEEGFEFFGQDRAEICSLVKLLGLSYCKENPTIDLTPSSMLQKSLKKSLSSSRKKIALYFAFALLALLAIATLSYKRKTDYVKDVKSFLRSIGDSVSTLNERKEITDLFLDKSTQGLFLDVFNEIAAVLPRGVSFNRFEYKKKNEIIIEGVSTDSKAIYQFYEEIKKLKDIKSIDSFKINVSSSTEVTFYLKLIPL